MSTRIKRREFITLLSGAVAAWPLAARGASRPGNYQIEHEAKEMTNLIDSVNNRPLPLNAPLGLNDDPRQVARRLPYRQAQHWL